MLTKVYINKSFICRKHSKATTSQWCDSSDVVLPTLLWWRRNNPNTGTEVNDSPTFPLGGAYLERCDVMWKLQWINCFICFWLRVKHVSLNGFTKTPDLNMLLQCNANNFSHTLRHTQHGDVWPSVSFMNSSWQSIFHLQGGYGKHLPRAFSCQTVTSQRPHEENEFVDVCQTPHILLVFSFYFSDFSVPWPLPQDRSCDITKKAQQWYYLICFSIRSKIWHFAPVLHQPSL